MGFLDRVKEKAQEGLEKGQELAKSQQLKHEVKKLDAALDDAYADYGRKAYALAESGTLAAGSLTLEATAIKDAIAARDAKQAEADADPGDDE